MTKTQNIFTVDLEEWFVVEALAGRHALDDWPSLPSRVINNSLRLLEMLKRHNVRATWFVLGWCAERYPDLIQEIFAAGHEIGCHSYHHRRVDSLRPDQFKKDTERAVNAILGATGALPYGYRAPSWSINGDNTWAFETLAEMGFLYDSSVFPIKHDLYGWPDGPRQPFKLDFGNGHQLYELPATTYRLLGKNIPVAGGGYFRHSPYWYSRKVIQSLNDAGHPVVFYIHPWEIDPDIPRMEHLSAIQRFRTYSSTSILRYKIERLLSDFSFTTAADYLKLFRKKRIGFE
ncbi:MAG: DUF3473 domain-containing protein [Candidatus Zixiibacteriota bacterium]|nr:MAG: DUF3473 domain-containing protein [candidate division Zixibacteria bacterium]